MKYLHLCAVYWSQMSPVGLICQTGKPSGKLIPALLASIYLKGEGEIHYLPFLEVSDGDKLKIFPLFTQVNDLGR